MSRPAVYEQFREKALRLTPEERVDLAYDLLDSVVPEEELVQLAEMDAAWADEIKQRMEELEAGLVETVPAAEVFARARERVRRFADIHSLSLTSEERVALAEELLDSVEPEAGETAGVDEIKRRVDEIRAGTAVTYSAEEVMAELRARYG